MVNVNKAKKRTWPDIAIAILGSQKKWKI